MLQFYFLSILLNVVTGLVFIYASKDSASVPADDDFDFSNDESNEADAISEEADKDSSSGFIKQTASSLEFLNDKTFRLVLGILMVLTGLLKLLSPIQYDIAIIGDLIPSLAGIAGGASLLVEWYEEKTALSMELPELLKTVFVEGRKYLGLFCIAAGVLHFVFPRVLFL